MLENPVTNNTSDIEPKKRMEILEDYRICCVSREVSLMGRKEVLTGKAKFGIFGAGKEVPQVAMAKAFKSGDFRSGYYRDQTFMFALGLCSLEEFFAQLYADADNDPFSGGRQMNSHFATPNIDENGEWTKHTEMYNITSDISSTGGQMARAAGIALASKLYRSNDKLQDKTDFSQNGDEVCFCTIGDASTSEGVFWETVNAAGVQKIPMAISIWDDGYGISVPIDYQTTKKNISEALAGFKLNEKGEGINIYRIKGNDYPGLCELYKTHIPEVRETHVPAIFHIVDLTQPQGHSTSGSHERYKTKERLEWERENDCILLMEKWMIAEGIVTEVELQEIKKKTQVEVKDARDKAWTAYQAPIKKRIKQVKECLASFIAEGIVPAKMTELQKELSTLYNPTLAEILKISRKASFFLKNIQATKKSVLLEIIRQDFIKADQDYHTNLYSHSKYSALRIPVVPAVYDEKAKTIPGYSLLNKCFDAALERMPHLYAFGEDVGQIGDVNQGFAGLQEKYGQSRVFDAGIREWTIMGQAIGMAYRGLRPIAEIQYIDYLIYGLAPLTDDLATLRYRSDGLQQAPAIIRTRGHRLEGIWHAGSPMGMMLSTLRGLYLCVPRNMTQAAGMYNTLLQADDPAIVVECLNGYRLREKLPTNVDSFTVPLGVPEVLQQGSDVTLVTYGSCIRVAEEAIKMLEEQDISVELVDVQTLLPFDLPNHILKSLQKTNRIVFLDEDVPGGATAYMMQEVLEKQNGYTHLDSAPQTITAKPHRTPYGSDGDYFSKPNAEDVFEVIYNVMHEAEPERFPLY